MHQGLGFIYVYVKFSVGMLCLMYIYICTCTPQLACQFVNTLKLYCRYKAAYEHEMQLLLDEMYFVLLLLSFGVKYLILDPT